MSSKQVMNGKTAYRVGVGITSTVVTLLGGSGLALAQAAPETIAPVEDISIVEPDPPIKTGNLREEAIAQIPTLASPSPWVNEISSPDETADSRPEVDTSPLIADEVPIEPSIEVIQDRLLQLEQQQQDLQSEINDLRQMLNTLTGTESPEDPSASTLAADADTDAEDLSTVELSASMLMLRPNTSGIQDYAIVDEGDPDVFVVSGDVAGVDYAVDTGLRVRLDYGLEESPVDFAFMYSSLYTHASDSVTRPENGFILATLANPAQNETADTARAILNLGYEVTDIEIGYQLHESDRLNLRLFSGLRIASIDQDLSVRYDGADFTNAQVTINRNFNGAGLRLGGRADFTLGSGFSLFTQAAGSLLIGNLSIDQQETDDGERDLIARLEETSGQEMVPGIEFSAGLRWETLIGDRARLGFAAGYELQNWLNVAGNMRSVDNSGTGVITQENQDLSLSGFFIQGNFAIEF